MKLLKNLFGSNPESKKTENKTTTTRGLEELKSILRETYYDGRVFSSQVKAVGYRFIEETPWGSVVMQKGDDKFIITIMSGGISSLIYRNDKHNISFDLVRDGRLMY